MLVSSIAVHLGTGRGKSEWPNLRKVAGHSHPARDAQARGGAPIHPLLANDFGPVCGEELTESHLTSLPFHGILIYVYWYRGGQSGHTREGNAEYAGGPEA